MTHSVPPYFFQIFPLAVLVQNNNMKTVNAVLHSVCVHGCFSYCFLNLIFSLTLDTALTTHTLAIFLLAVRVV